ncbi:MAG: hypothetical protein A3H97_23745 [Acidobacteria bacterium RIFCSPLOWO2_02_FULL_65_29]|nr:MAG: hypothetical protein A3H97_23745 [Acidobacteria bacterium RIFCSPLOWO2_02_FULL_65_29]
MPGAFVIRSVRYDGQDVTDTGIDFKPDTEIRDIEVELTNQATTVTGAVTDPKGQPSKDFSVVVFSQDRDLWTPTSRHIALGRPDQEGTGQPGSHPPGCAQVNKS